MTNTSTSAWNHLQVSMSRNLVISERWDTLEGLAYSFWFKKRDSPSKKRPEGEHPISIFFKHHLTTTDFHTLPLVTLAARSVPMMGHSSPSLRCCNIVRQGSPQDQNFTETYGNMIQYSVYNSKSLWSHQTLLTRLPSHLSASRTKALPLLRNW